MNHVMIVGERRTATTPPVSQAGPDFRLVLSWLRAASPSPGFSFGTCSAPGELEAKVRELGGGNIDLLDIYDHGREGALWLGGNEHDVLFSSDATSDRLHGADIAEQLGKLLSPTGHVRLLGCETGVGPRGRMLLVKLAHHLGERRTAFAPIVDVIVEHFNPHTGRFTTPEYLFSSLGALDREAPSKRERDFETAIYP